VSITKQNLKEKKGVWWIMGLGIEWVWDEG